MRERIVLGFNLGFNASAVLYSSQRGMLAAISEERVNNEKNTKKFPIGAIIKCLEIAKVHPQDVALVTYCHYARHDMVGLLKYLPDIFPVERFSAQLQDTIKLLIPKLENIDSEYEFSIMQEVQASVIMQMLQELLMCAGINAPIQRANHHTSHAYPAFFFSGFEDPTSTLVVTMDGFGDCVSGCISRVNENYHLEPLSINKMSGSVGLVYQFITGALGFKEHQHEGKVTGLAAYGKPLYMDFFSNLMAIRDGEIMWVGGTAIDKSQYQYNPITDFGDFQNIRQTIYDWVDTLKVDGELAFDVKQNVACSVQLWAEYIITTWISGMIKKHKEKTGVSCVNICLAGGVFANVKINQKVHEIPDVKSIFVYPAMGDEGTAVGSMFSVLMRHNEYFAYGKTQSMFLGSEYNNYEIAKAITLFQQEDFIYEIVDSEEIPTRIAKALSEEKIVCRFTGRMEFGPRALCHRSIMYHCKEREVNTWLNNQLGRTEFMPFAPFCKIENADMLFRNMIGKKHAAEFMTITANCTQEFIDNYPAACHVDNTARPQLISYKNNPEAWNILNAYENLTGEKVLINTSFNLHNYPIIESPEIAIKSWLKSNTDMLVIGDYVLTQERRS